MTGLLNYRRILLSAVVIAFVTSLVFAGTQAFFSDEETSTGNTFTAGELDLTIDNTSYGFDYNDPSNESPTGEWGQNTNNSWQLSDLTDQLFFNFGDLKPGDYGEDTISLHVQNDAWACVAFDLTSTPDNGINEPEEGAGDVTDGADGGELQNYLSFIFWNDDGDNVLENDEDVIQDLTGLPGDVFNGDWLALTESGDTPLAAGETTYIGKGWCFGSITEDPVTQDNANDNPPLAPDRIGFTCDGSGDHNDAQTDGIVVDVHFYSEQSRNNDGFLCSALDPIGGGDDRPTVGALLSSFDDPERVDCNAIVGDTVAGDITHTSIQAANDAAADASTICVDPEYTGAGDTFPVTLDVLDLTVVGLGAQGDASIPGGFFINNSGITVSGLEFTDFSFIASSEDAAIYIHNEAGQGSGVALTGTTIEHNIFTAPGDAKAELAKAIVTEIGAGVGPVATGIDVLHNTFDGWRQAMFFNTAADYEVAFNDILNNDVGVANDGPHNASIHNNDFEGNALEAVGVAPSAVNGTANNGLLAVNTNNFAPGASLGNDVNWYGSSVQGGADVDATGNWWDGDAEAARTNDITEVDTSGESAVAFPEN